VRQAKPTQSLSRILPALIHVQAHLDQDLSLDLLADEAGLSKFHFHQLFRRATGETPKSYVDRLRLEWAALQLRIRRARVLDIALESGYRNHETFSRAFRGRFAMSPREFRQQWARRVRGLPQAPSTTNAPHGGELSATRIVQLARMIVAFVRHVGPYEQVSERQFRRLANWARRRGVAGEPPLLLGIAYDAPGITPPDKIASTAVFRSPRGSRRKATLPANASRVATMQRRTTLARGTCATPMARSCSDFN